MPVVRAGYVNNCEIICIATSSLYNPDLSQSLKKQGSKIAQCILHNNYNNLKYDPYGKMILYQNSSYLNK